MNRRRFITFVLGAAVTSPFAARAQRPPYRIGYLALQPSEDKGFMKAFVGRLHQLGIVEGQNLTLTYRSAEGNPEHLGQLAAELLQSKPDVLVAGFGTLTAKAAQAATSSIPIVFTSVGDPVGAGLIGSLGQPGGNLTGFSTQLADLGGKKLQLIREMVPGARTIAILLNPQTPATKASLKSILAAADTGQAHLKVFEVSSPTQIAAQVEAAAKGGASAMIVLEDPLILGARQDVARLAIQHRLPTLFGDRTFTESGGLMSYGPDRRDNFRRAADYVVQILKGTKPGDLPVEQPRRFELVINSRTANTLGLPLAPGLLSKADEVLD